MQEVRVTVPRGEAAALAQVLLNAGLKEVTVYRAYSHGPEEEKEVLSAELSTPAVKAVVEALLHAPTYDPQRMKITCRTLAAIISDETQDQLTIPVYWARAEVLAELWQNSHITAGFVSRAAVASALLAYSLVQASPISVVIALLFTPFLSVALGVSFGACRSDWPLVRQALTALVTSTGLAIAAGFLVGLATGGPIQLEPFKHAPVSVLLSAGIGLVAGLSTADDVGHNFVIAVAASAQYAMYPVWFGLWLAVRGTDQTVVWERVGTFAANVITILAVSAATYWWVSRPGQVPAPRHASGSRPAKHA